MYITFSSCFYIIKSKFEPSIYIQWMNNFISIVNKFNLVIYTDENSCKYINTNGNTKTQYIKLQEESGELARAILKDNKSELIDAIGDMIVVLTNLAALEGLKVEECVVSAYEVIKSRQGSMVNGTFVKQDYAASTAPSLNDHIKTTL